MLLAGNRAEEYSLDIWQNFVIPPYFKEISMLQTRKPMMIVGGRGCGKTMLLRYFCYETQFSKDRGTFGVEAINRIGLYWKIDTQFAKILSNRGEDNNNWSNIFTHLGVLELGLGVINSLLKLKDSNFNLEEKDGILNIHFVELRGFDKDLPDTILELKKYFEFSIQKLQIWVVNNFKKLDPPLLFPISFLKCLINTIRDQVAFLKGTDFFVYIDEYENLLQSQKKIVNTWIKHSETPLIFNVAMKRNAFDVRDTIGNESIVNIHDYRKFDIEELLDKHHHVFASEILFLRLKQANLESIVPININNLFKTDDDILRNRRSAEYEKIITDKAKSIFPSYTQKQLADEILNDSKLNDRLQGLINETLNKRDSSYSLNDFYDKSFPEATLVNFALLNRKQIKDVDLFAEFSLLKNGELNKYTGKTNWIHNNTIGCVLYLYSKVGRLCPFYAGFESFCEMSKGNIRHFLELCSQSIVNCGDSFEKTCQVSIKDQSSASKLVSASMLNEIKSLGNKGSSLYTFVIRLGTIFEYCRNNISQSEPEQNHFTIKDNLSEDSSKFLSELEKWSVIYTYKLTKSKSGEFGSEYILNPIYSYYFNISYRKKRRIILSDNDFKIIAFHEVSDFERLIRKFNKVAEKAPNLFELF